MKKLFIAILSLFVINSLFADERLLPPENYLQYSQNQKYFLNCNPENKTTVCYEMPDVETDLMDPANPAEEKWRINEWAPFSYVSDDGEFCALNWDGELVPDDVYKSYVLFKIYKSGKKYSTILLSDIIKNRENLETTVSHNYWGRIKSFTSDVIIFDTVEGKKRYDMKKKTFMDEKYVQGFEGKGADSPEKAVKEYLNAFKSCDYDKIISCYSIETFVENYDIELDIKRFTAAPLTMKMIYPKDNFLKQISRYEILDSIIRTIKFQTWNLCGSGFFINGQHVLLEDNLQNLVNQVFPIDAQKKLSSIKIEKVIPNDEFLLYLITGDFSSNSLDYEEEIDTFRQTVKRHHEKMKLIYGAKNVEDVIVKFSIKSKVYYFVAETIEYDNKWYISPNQAIVASLLGMAVSNGWLVDEDFLKHD